MARVRVRSEFFDRLSMGQDKVFGHKYTKIAAGAVGAGIFGESIFNTLRLFKNNPQVPKNLILSEAGSRLFGITILGGLGFCWLASIAALFCMPSYDEYENIKHYRRYA